MTDNHETMAVLVPPQEELDRIREQGFHGSVLSKSVGPYWLYAIYRESSAYNAHGAWYCETGIFKDSKWLYQGEGWASFLHLANNLNTEAEVEAFLKQMEDDDDR